MVTIQPQYKGPVAAKGVIRRIGEATVTLYSDSSTEGRRAFDLVDSGYTVLALFRASADPMDGDSVRVAGMSEVLDTDGGKRNAILVASWNSVGRRPLADVWETLVWGHFAVGVSVVVILLTVVSVSLVYRGTEWTYQWTRRRPRDMYMVLWIQGGATFAGVFLALGIQNIADTGAEKRELVAHLNATAVSVSSRRNDVKVILDSTRTQGIRFLDNNAIPNAPSIEGLLGSRLVQKFTPILISALSTSPDELARYVLLANETRADSTKRIAVALILKSRLEHVNRMLDYAADFLDGQFPYENFVRLVLASDGQCAVEMQPRLEQLGRTRYTRRTPLY